MRQPFENAVEEHGRAVLLVCRARLGAADADDAWSETFLAALRAWPELDEDADVEAWLVTIAGRKAIDIHRARSRNPIPVEEVAAVADGGADFELPADDGLWGLVADLPERQRLAVAYHYLGGLRHTETAAIIGGSPAAVRRAAADGVAALRRRLNVPEREERR